MWIYALIIVCFCVWSLTSSSSVKLFQTKDLESDNKLWSFRGSRFFSLLFLFWRLSISEVRLCGSVWGFTVNFIRLRQYSLQSTAFITTDNEGKRIRLQIHSFTKIQYDKKKKKLWGSYGRTHWFPVDSVFSGSRLNLCFSITCYLQSEVLHVANDKTNESFIGRTFVTLRFYETWAWTTSTGG